MISLFSLLLACAVSQPAAATAEGTAQLADWALEKVLQDGSQLFGDYNLALRSKSRTSEWMKYIPDDTPLVHMNIPGTHDSGSWNFTSALLQDVYVDSNVTDTEDYRCQEHSIAAMLDAGIRFFDLRPALDPTRSYLTIWHGPVEASQIGSVEDIMFAFYAWLENHPSEVLLLSFQYQAGTVPGFQQDEKFEEVLFNMLTSSAAKKYISQKDGELGTLGEARGKIILFKRFDIEYLSSGMNAQIPGLHLSPSLWTDNDANITFIYNKTTGATVYVEDHYDVSTSNLHSSPSANIAIKVNASISHLELAAHGTAANSLFITFLSSENTANVPDMTPRAMALGFGNSSTPIGGVNQQMNRYLKAHEGQRFGIVVADFFNEPADLIDSILEAKE